MAGNKAPPPKISNYTMIWTLLYTNTGLLATGASLTYYRLVVEVVVALVSRIYATLIPVISQVAHDTCVSRPRTGLGLLQKSICE
jgi:hypothetical protein